MEESHNEGDENEYSQTQIREKAKNGRLNRRLDAFKKIVHDNRVVRTVAIATSVIVALGFIIGFLADSLSLADRISAKTIAIDIPIINIRLIAQPIGGATYTPDQQIFAALAAGYLIVLAVIFWVGYRYGVQSVTTRIIGYDNYGSIYKSGIGCSSYILIVLVAAGALAFATMSTMLGMDGVMGVIVGLVTFALAFFAGMFIAIRDARPRIRF